MPDSERSSTSWQGREMTDTRSAWARTSGRPGAQPMRPGLREDGSEKARRIRDPLGIAAGASTRNKSTGTRMRTLTQGHSGNRNPGRGTVRPRGHRGPGTARTPARTRSGRLGGNVRTSKRFAWDPVARLRQYCRPSKMRWPQQDFTVERASWQERGQGRDMGRKASWSSQGAPSSR